MERVTNATSAAEHALLMSSPAVGSNPVTATRLRVYGTLLLGIVCIALSAIFTGIAQVPGPVSALYRLAIAEVALAPLFIRSASRGSVRYDRRTWLLALAAGVFFALDLGMWNTSLLLTPVANSTLLANDAPILVGLIAFLVFRERLKPLYWIGLAVAVTGMVIIIGPDVIDRAHSSLGLGDGLALAAGVSYALYLTITQRVRAHMDTLASLWIPTLASTLLLLVFDLATHQALGGFSTRAWIALLGLGLISQALGWMAINYALGHLPASIVSVTLLGQPVLTAILAVPLLSQPLGPLQMLGGAVALAGIFLVNRAGQR